MTEDPGILEPTLSKHYPQMLLLTFMCSPRDFPKAPDAANDFSRVKKVSFLHWFLTKSCDLCYMLLMGEASTWRNGVCVCGGGVKITNEHVMSSLISSRAKKEIER